MLRKQRAFRMERALSIFADLSTHRHRCLFIIHVNEREVINYRLRVDEGGRERVQLVEGRSCTLVLILRKSMRFLMYIGHKMILLT